METENLVRMVNRIGDFFQSMPDHQEAMDGIVQHIRKFWAPSMRRELFNYVDQSEGAGLSMLVLQAITAQRSYLLPQQPVA